MDGVETVTGGHLIGQFLSPRTNCRTDAFGGSTANRARFGLMVHEAIRKRVGDDFLVGIRFVVDEDTGFTGDNDGIDFDECVRLARLFEAEGHLDFFNAIFGRMDTDLALSEHNMPGMSQPLTPFLAKVGAFKRRPCCRCSMPRASPMSRPPGTPSPRAARHGGDDPGAHGGPADREQADAWRGGAHPPHA